MNEHSADWIANAAALGPFSINDLRAHYTRDPNDTELAFPVYRDHAGSNTPVRFHCTANFGGSPHPCNIEGLTVNVDPRMLPQNGGEPDGGHLDAHWALVDSAGGYEYDAWQTHWPPRDGVLDISWGGRCSLDGNGFTNHSYAGPHWNSGCTADASGTPLSLAALRVKDLLLAARDGRSLPYAIALAYGCTGVSKKLADPFLSGGDGRCAGAVPEGTRLYLALHDAQIEALGAKPIVAAILRTLDEDHYGAFIIDSEDKAKPGFTVDVQTDETYAAFTGDQPWLHTFVPEARREELNVSEDPLHGRSFIKLELPPAITWDVVRFW